MALQIGSSVVRAKLSTLGLPKRAFEFILYLPLGARPKRERNTCFGVRFSQPEGGLGGGCCSSCLSRSISGSNRFRCFMDQFRNKHHKTELRFGSISPTCNYTL